MDNVKIREQIRDEFTEYLISNKHRRTPERYAILDHIYSTKGHFDMDSLYTSMKEAHFRVSRATLYNTIELLLDCGLVVRHQFGANVSKYERAYGNENHDHMICLSCGDVKESKNSNLFTAAQQKRLKSFKVSYYSMYIYGICAKCERAKKKAARSEQKNTKTSSKVQTLAKTKQKQIKDNSRK